MSTIVTRAGKGSPLTHNEVDANFNNLNNDKYQSGDSPTFVTVNATTVDATNVEVTNVKAKDGTAAIVIADSTGNVGIGTASPSSKLSVGGNPPTSGVLAGVSAANGISLALSDNTNNSLYVKHVSGGAATIGTDSGGQLAFATNGFTERMRIDGSTGNVGIGTASPVTKLQSAGTSGSAQFRAGTASNGYFEVNAFDSNPVYCVVGGSNATAGVFGTQSNIPSIFFTNNTERMRIDGSTGNVGIGGTADAYDKVAIKGTLPSSSLISVSCAARGTIPSSSTSEGYGFGSQVSTQAASFTLGSLRHFYATQGTIGAGSTVTNQIGFFAENTLTGATNNYGFFSNIASGSNRFNFYANGTADNYFAGNVGIGTASPSFKFEVQQGSSSASPSLRQTPQVVLKGYGGGSTYHSGIGFSMYEHTNGYWGSGILEVDDTNNYGAAMAFYTSNGSATPTPSERMRITSGGEVYIAGTTDQGAYNLQCNGTGVWGAGAYVNGSDERLKDNIQSLDSGLDVIKAMRPVTFQYKPEYSKDQNVQPGFIAQELQTAMAGKPYLEGVVQEGTNHLNVAYQSIIPILVKAIQELEAKVAALEAK